MLSETLQLKITKTSSCLTDLAPRLPLLAEIGAITDLIPSLVLLRSRFDEKHLSIPLQNGAL